MSRRVARPIHRMVAATGRIASGHYAERLPVELDGRSDELTSLAVSFNEMVTSLQQTQKRRLSLVGDVASRSVRRWKGFREPMTFITQPLRDEHQHLLPHVEQLRTAADSVGDGPPDVVHRNVEECYEFLAHHLIPHAQAEEHALYPGCGESSRRLRVHSYHEP